MGARAHVKKDLSIKDGTRVFIDFALDEITLDHGIAHRIEFREKRCNLTLKNKTTTRQAVTVRVFVLNAALIEIWKQTERWSLASLQPDQIHAVSWTFSPELPDVVWNEKARLIEPRWIVVDVL